MYRKLFTSQTRQFNPNNNKVIFSSHFSSYVQPKTILLQYKSIVFGWTYELKSLIQFNKNKQTCRPSKGQNKMSLTLVVGQLLMVKRKNSSPSKIIRGYFGAPYGPRKYVFAKINPTIVFSANKENNVFKDGIGV